MAFGKVAAAALVFGILYAVMFAYMSWMYATKRYKWKSRFTILFFHCAIRVASQACGVAFGVLLWRNLNVFVAYLILGAEGYFSLTIASYYFLRSYELKNFDRSRLGTKEKPKSTWLRSLEIWTFAPLWAPWRYWNDNLIMIVDSWLIPANAIIIAGGSLMVGANDTSDTRFTDEQRADRLNTAKALRTAGQAIFLALTVFWVGLVTNTWIKTVRRRLSNRARTAVLIFLAIGFFLLMRGVFGVLQSAIWKLSYYNPGNYDEHGFTSEFVAVENVLAVMPEFVAAALLNASYWPNRKLKGEAESMTELQQKGERHVSRDSDLTHKNSTPA